MTKATSLLLFLLPFVAAAEVVKQTLAGSNSEVDQVLSAASRSGKRSFVPLAARDVTELSQERWGTPLSVTGSNRMLKRQTTCPTGMVKVECPDKVGCCDVGSVCVVISGENGCCPIGTYLRTPSPSLPY
jgi:hypothetical protein